MKISRFIVVMLFGLGLISQNSFSYDTVNKNNKVTHKKTKHHDKGACKKSILPLFNKEENRPCKKDVKEVKDEKPTVKEQVKAKYEKAAKKLGVKHDEKHPKKDASCEKGCHKSVFPLFNKKENKTCICPKVDKNKPATK